MRTRVRYVRERARRRTEPRGGRAPCFWHRLGVAHPRAPGASAARGWRVFLEAAGAARLTCSCRCLSGPGDTCLPEPGPHRAGAQCTRVSVSVCPCPRGRLHVARRRPAARRSRAGGGRTARGGSAAASSAPCASWRRDLLRLHVPRGGAAPVCVPRLHGFLWFCVSCRVPPSFCDHPRRFWKRLGAPAVGVGGGPGRGRFPLPLPAPQAHLEVFPCVGREQA